jgi:hypothetical protein
MNSVPMTLPRRSTLFTRSAQTHRSRTSATLKYVWLKLAQLPLLELAIPSDQIHEPAYVFTLDVIFDRNTPPREMAVRVEMNSTERKSARSTFQFSNSCSIALNEEHWLSVLGFWQGCLTFIAALTDNPAVKAQVASQLRLAVLMAPFTFTGHITAPLQSFILSAGIDVVSTSIMYRTVRDSVVYGSKNQEIMILLLNRTVFSAFQPITVVANQYQLTIYDDLS